MTRSQAEHRVSYIQRQLNLQRSSPNPMVEKVSIPDAKPEDIVTPIHNSKDINNVVVRAQQAFNDAASKLKEDDVKLLDDLHGNNIDDVAAMAADPQEFRQVAEAAKAFNDLTHAYGYRLGQPIPYRQEYGARLLFDLKDPESRENFLKVATPTEKGYTLPRNIKNYDVAAKLGIKRKNENFIQDLNQDAAERINDLRRLSTQQALEQAYPGKVAVGEIPRDSETGKLYKQLTIQNGTHLSMPADIADLVNNRSRIESAPDLGVREGNVKSAIAQSVGIADKINDGFRRVREVAIRLSDNDKNLLYEYDNGGRLEDIAKAAENPAKFMRVATAVQDALDTAHTENVRVSGLEQLRPQNEIPHYFAASKERMDELGIPESQRLNDPKLKTPGFVDTKGKYKSYDDAQKDELSPLFSNPLAAVDYYGRNAANRARSQALFASLSHAAPGDIAERGVRAEDEAGKPFKQAAGTLGFDASDKLNKRLNYYKQAWQPNNPIAAGTLKSLETVVSGSKKLLFFGTPFHYANETVRFGGATILHPVVALRGMADALFTQVGGYNRLVRAAEKDGTMDWIRKSGTPLQTPERTGLIARTPEGSIRIGTTLDPTRFTNRKLSEFGNALTLSLARFAKDNGIDPLSETGTKLGAEYGKVVGRLNAAVRGSDPNFRKILSNTALAPDWIDTSFGLIKDAVTSTVGPQRTGRGIGLLNPGDVARGTVIGARALTAAGALIGSAIATGKFPTLQH